MIDTYNFLADKYAPWGLALMALLAVLFIVQVLKYAAVFGRIPSFRNKRRNEGEPPPVSVVITINSEDYDYLSQGLSAIMAQEGTAFEVVAVYVGRSEEFFETLAGLTEHYPNLATTHIAQDPRFPISHKMALNVGIKAAHYNHIILTTTDAAPASSRWLALMSKGFLAGDIVLGYCGMERMRGFADMWIRSSRLMHSMRWLGRAVRCKPHRGTMHNIGFTKDIYFRAKGFDHLDMNIGEDDLFIQKIAAGRHAGVILSPSATVTQRRWGGLGWWSKECRYRDYAFRYYPRAVKFGTQCELWSRFLFFAAAVAAVILLPAEIKIGAAALVLLRYGVVLLEVQRVARKVGERGLAGGYLLYDLLSPFTEAWQALRRTLKPSAGIWRAGR